MLAGGSVSEISRSLSFFKMECFSDRLQRSQRRKFDVLCKKENSHVTKKYSFRGYFNLNPVKPIVRKIQKRKEMRIL